MKVAGVLDAQVRNQGLRRVSDDHERRALPVDEVPPVGRDTEWEGVPPSRCRDLGMHGDRRDAPELPFPASRRRAGRARGDDRECGQQDCAVRPSTQLRHGHRAGSAFFIVTARRARRGQALRRRSRPAPTSRVTTAPAPMSAPSPMRIPPRTTHPEPSEARPLDDACGSRLQSSARLQLAVLGRRTRPLVVDEEDPVPHEDLVLDRDAGADERVALDLAAGADLDAPLDLDERPDLGLVADAAAVEIREGVDDDALTELDVVRAAGTEPRSRGRQSASGEVLAQRRRRPSPAGLRSCPGRSAATAPRATAPPRPESRPGR